MAFLFGGCTTTVTAVMTKWRYWDRQDQSQLWPSTKKRCQLYCADWKSKTEPAAASPKFPMSPASFSSLRSRVVVSLQALLCWGQDSRGPQSDGCAGCGSILLACWT